MVNQGSICQQGIPQLQECGEGELPAEEKPQPASGGRGRRKGGREREGRGRREGEEGRVGGGESKGEGERSNVNR